MDPLDEATVRKIATLARLSLSDGDVARMQGELTQILHHVEQLEQLDTSNVEPLSHAADVANQWRMDECRESLNREDALKNAPDQTGEFFLVPNVMRDKSG